VDDRLTFLGHSTVLVDLDGVRVLTDPMLGHMAGVIRRQWPVASPSALADLAAVFISHGHWDHLDMPSLRGLPVRQRSSSRSGSGGSSQRRRPGVVH